MTFNGELTLLTGTKIIVQSSDDNDHNPFGIYYKLIHYNNGTDWIKPDKEYMIDSLILKIEQSSELPVLNQQVPKRLRLRF